MLRWLWVSCLVSTVATSLECGRVPLDDVLKSRVVGGHAPAEGNWPFIAYVQYSNVSLCSGSIVGPRHVLTAGHCVGSTNGSMPKLYDASKLQVRTGSVRPKNGTRRNVTNIFPGPLWYKSKNTTVDDVAILKLEEPIEFDDYAQPICLPKSFRERPGDPGYFVGWGRQNKIPEPHNDTVDYESGAAIANENIVTFRKWRHCRLSDGPYLHREDYICAGQYMRLAHRGDSGGPLMVNRKGLWLQVGTDSVGKKQNGTGYGMFARVTSYCKWFTDVTKGEVNCVKL